MLYGTPPLATAGQHRSPREPERAAELLIRGLGGLILLALLAVTVFFVVAGEQHRNDAPVVTDPPPAVNAAPLTLEEVFPDPDAVRPPDVKPYRITMTHIDADCRTATLGDVGALLDAHGCSQVVRAGLVAPYGDYRVTAGVFTLADEAGAVEVDGRLRRLVETGDGSFTTLPGGRLDPDTLPTSQVGWRARGHYLLYCVINRPDGELVAVDDPYAARITSDLVDSYLGGTVMGAA
jgi:hypothetical protein